MKEEKNKDKFKNGKTIEPVTHTHTHTQCI